MITCRYRRKQLTDFPLAEPVPRPAKMALQFDTVGIPGQLVQLFETHRDQVARHALAAAGTSIGAMGLAMDIEPAGTGQQAQHLLRRRAGLQQCRHVWKGFKLALDGLHHRVVRIRKQLEHQAAGMADAVPGHLDPQADHRGDLFGDGQVRGQVLGDFTGDECDPPDIGLFKLLVADHHQRSLADDRADVELSPGHVNRFDDRLQNLAADGRAVFADHSHALDRPVGLNDRGDCVARLIEILGKHQDSAEQSAHGRGRSRGQPVDSDRFAAELRRPAGKRAYGVVEGRRADDQIVRFLCWKNGIAHGKLLKKSSTRQVR